MGDLFDVLFVCCILFSTGLSVPTKMKVRARQIHHNDRADSTVAESTPSIDTVLEVNDSNDEKEIQHKILNIPDMFEDPMQDRQSIIKDRSLVKLIKKSKTHNKFKLRDTIASDMFSFLSHDPNNNTIDFQEVYPSGQQSRNEKHISVNHKMPLPKNITVSDIRIPHNKYEFVYTYLPIASLANQSNHKDIEIIKNTIIHTDPISNNKKRTDKNEKAAATKNMKHNVRKYFRLHSSIAKELEDNQFEGKHALAGSGIRWSAASDVGQNKNLSQDAEPPSDVPHPRTIPRMQSIVLRWNLILI